MGFELYSEQERAEGLGYGKVLLSLELYDSGAPMVLEASMVREGRV